MIGAGNHLKLLAPRRADTLQLFGLDKGNDLVMLGMEDIGGLLHCGDFFQIAEAVRLGIAAAAAVASFFNSICWLLS